MTDQQFIDIMAVLNSIRVYVEFQPTLTTAVILLMFAIGWSSSGR